MKLLITDLDNTLYDWVSYFATAFSAMVEDLAGILNVPREQLLDEFQVIHRRYGNSEYPFAIFELPSVQERFPRASRNELLEHLDSPLSAFRVARQNHLRVYPGVSDTLETLRSAGVAVVAHTEAFAVHAYYRLRTLDLVSYFNHIYALNTYLEPHPNPMRMADLEPPVGLIELVPKAERKPNPQLLLDICRKEGVLPSDACYVGDSLTRDVAMAKSAGVTAVWARYGTRYDRDLWQAIVRVSHWTHEDVVREAELVRLAADVQPDYTIDGFKDILAIPQLASVAELQTNQQSE